MAVKEFVSFLSEGDKNCFCCNTYSTQ